MQKFTLAAAAGAAMLFAAPGLAQAETYATLGYTHIDDRGADVGAITGRLGMRLTPNFAVEGEYSHGVEGDTNARLDNAWGVYGVGVLPVNPNVDLFARVGYSRIDQDGRNAFAGVNRNDDGLAVGVGAQLSLGDAWGVRGDYTRHEGDRRAHLVGASVVRSF